MTRYQKFLYNGLLLTAASLLLRGVGVIFGVYLSGRIGAEAMGLYALIASVYSFALTVATSGVGLAVTRLISEAMGEVTASGITLAEGKTNRIRSIVKKCLFYALFFSALSSILLLVLAKPIGIRLLGDPRTVSCLRLLSVSLVPISVTSVFSGYFNAVRRVWKNALSQVLEQFFKIALTSSLLTLLFAQSVEGACLCVVAGGVCAELFSFVLQTGLYLAEKRHTDSPRPTGQENRLLRNRLLSISLPVALSAYARSGLVTVEHILIPYGLERYGTGRSASLAAYGTVQSMVFPIIFFPSAILSSFSLLLVPEVAEARAEGNEARVSSIVRRVFQTAMLFAIGCAGVMTFCATEIASAIYPETEAAYYLRLLSPLIPVMYLDTSVDALLKGLGEQVYSMGINIADALLSVALVWFLLPRYGILGYIATVYVTETVNAALSISRLLRVSTVRPTLIRWAVVPLLCVFSSTLLCRTLFSHLPSLPAIQEMLLHVSLTLLFYLLPLFLWDFLFRRKAKITSAIHP